MLEVGDRMLVDSRTAADPEHALHHVAKLMRRLPVTDLSWIRLAPWRNHLAGLFDDEANRPFLGGVEVVEVAGHFAPRLLLAGWVSGRLNPAPAAVRLRDSTHVSIRITAKHRGRRGHFAVTRPGHGRVIVTKVDLEDSPSQARTLPMRDRRPARALAEALSHSDGDDTYNRALVCALALRPGPN